MRAKDTDGTQPAVPLRAGDTILLRGNETRSEAMAEETPDVIAGDGYAVGSIEALGEGYGFRKIRQGLGVTAFGVNAIVMPAGYESGRHYHDEQEELYFVHQGRVEFEFGDGTNHVLGPGGLARVDAATVRKIKNVGDDDAVYVIAGGKDGYVGRDGRMPEGEQRSQASGPPGAP
jgi:quercetin dioxygenase-like cupin family protein